MGSRLTVSGGHAGRSWGGPASQLTDIDQRRGTLPQHPARDCTVVDNNVVIIKNETIALDQSCAQA